MKESNTEMAQDLLPEEPSSAQEKIGALEFEVRVLKREICSIYILCDLLILFSFALLGILYFLR